MMNTDAVEFNFIVAKGQISKLAVVGVCTFIGFILGYNILVEPLVISNFSIWFEGKAARLLASNKEKNSSWVEENNKSSQGG